MVLGELQRMVDRVGMAEGKLILVGGGGHAAVVAQCAHQLGVEVVGLYDDDAGAKLLHRPPPPVVPGYLGTIEDFVGSQAAGWVLAIGDLGARARVLERYCECASGPVIHPDAIVSPDVEIEEGVFVGPGAIIHTGAKIRAHAIINTGAIVEHDCVIGKNAHIAPGCVLGGGTQIGEHSLVGIGSTVLPMMVIGQGATIGAGSVVIRSVDDGAVVAGNPARVLVRD